MSTGVEAASPNAEQARYWTSPSGHKWIELQQPFDATFAPVSRLLLAKASPRTGEQILDLGCGTGATAFDLAERVGPEGRIMAVDISAPLLAHARARTPSGLASRIEFLEADAQIFAFPAGRFDALVSRFGSMFFAEPAVAFRNLRRALRSGGRLHLAAWGPSEVNPWFTIPRDAAVARLGRPAPVPPTAPGPLAFADRDRVLDILRDAGFAAPEAEAVTVELEPPGDIQEVAELMSSVGPGVRIIAELHGGPADLEAVRRTVTEQLGQYRVPGGIRVPAAINLFSAVAP